MKGRSVTVLRPVAGELDRFGNATVETYEPEVVDDVLIQRSETSDLEASRHEGVRASFTLHFPQGYGKTLEGCKVMLPEPFVGLYRVVGAPYPYMEENCPTRWSMPVDVEAVDG